MCVCAVLDEVLFGDDEDQDTEDVVDEDLSDLEADLVVD